MKKDPSRRKFLQSLALLPLFTSFPALAMERKQNAVSENHGHKFKISLNAYSFNSLLRDGKIDLFDLLEFCAEHNFDALDPTGYYFPDYPAVPDNSFINEFKRKAFLLGLDLSGTGVRNDFTNPSEEMRNADKVMIKKWIKAAARLGIPNLRVFAGKQAHEGYTRAQVFEWMAKDLRECCDVGKEYGVMIALQNHNDFLKTAKDVERIFSMVDSEWLGLNLDIGSYRQSDPYQEIEQNIKYAITWQIKENVWVNNTQVPTDFVKLFRSIKKAAYRGYLPIETLGPGDPYLKVQTLLKKVRKAIAEIGD